MRVSLVLVPCGRGDECPRVKVNDNLSSAVSAAGFCTVAQRTQASRTGVLFLKEMKLQEKLYNIEIAPPSVAVNAENIIYL